ncbi:MAG: CHRD domain-containing protein [bacterium]
MALLIAVVALLAMPVATVPAAPDPTFRARLSGFEETPVTLSSPASGHFRARIHEAAGVIEFELSYAGLPTTVTAAHIHLGARATTGGVSAFFCGGGGKPPCPQGGGTVTGTIVPSDVIGPAAQGIASGEFGELVTAIRAGATYANVHTTQFPGGEIRGQIDRRRRGGD